MFAKDINEKTDASDFNAVIEAFGWEYHPYMGLASTTEIMEKWTRYQRDIALLNETSKVI
jgi:hypothetical protein